jgi:hypothetical protein
MVPFFMINHRSWSPFLSASMSDMAFGTVVRLLARWDGPLALTVVVGIVITLSKSIFMKSPRQCVQRVFNPLNIGLELVHQVCVMDDCCWVHDIEWLVVFYGPLSESSDSDDDLRLEEIYLFFEERPATGDFKVGRWPVDSVIRNGPAFDQ